MLVDERMRLKSKHKNNDEHCDQTGSKALFQRRWILQSSPPFKPQSVQKDSKLSLVKRQATSFQGQRSALAFHTKWSARALMVAQLQQPMSARIHATSATSVAQKQGGNVSNAASIFVWQAATQRTESSNFIPVVKRKMSKATPRGWRRCTGSPVTMLPTIMPFRRLSRSGRTAQYNEMHISTLQSTSSNEQSNSNICVPPAGR